MRLCGANSRQRSGRRSQAVLTLRCSTSWAFWNLRSWLMISWHSLTSQKRKKARKRKMRLKKRKLKLPKKKPKRHRTNAWSMKNTEKGNSWILRRKKKSYSHRMAQVMKESSHKTFLLQGLPWDSLKKKLKRMTTLKRRWSKRKKKRKTTVLKTTVQKNQATVAIAAVLKKFTSETINFGSRRTKENSKRSESRSIYLALLTLWILFC